MAVYLSIRQCYYINILPSLQIYKQRCQQEGADTSAYGTGFPIDTLILNTVTKNSGMQHENLTKEIWYNKKKKLYGFNLLP